MQGIIPDTRGSKCRGNLHSLASRRRRPLISVAEVRGREAAAPARANLAHGYHGKPGLSPSAWPATAAYTRHPLQTRQDGAPHASQVRAAPSALAKPIVAQGAPLRPLAPNRPSSQEPPSRERLGVEWGATLPPHGAREAGTAPGPTRPAGLARHPWAAPSGVASQGKG